MSDHADSFGEQALGYLLGRLSDEEAERFETRLLAEDRSEELAAIEDELIDRAVQDELRVEERGPFDSHFRGLPGREEKIRFARALCRAARSSTPVPITRRVAPRRRLAGRTAWFAMSAMAAAAAVLLVLSLRGPGGHQESVVATHALDAAAGVETAKAPPTPQIPPSPPALPAPPTPVAPPEMQRPRGADPEPAPVMLALALSSTRGAGNRELAIPATAKRVILSVDLEGETAFSTFRATLTGAGGESVWSAARLSADRSSGALILRVPAAVLPPGSYRLAIGGIKASGPIEDLGAFALRVTRGPTPRR